MAVIPSPAPRKSRPLPWVAVGLMSLGGLLLFGFLWQVAVELQRDVAPVPKPQTWEQKP